MDDQGISGAHMLRAEIVEMWVTEGWLLPSARDDRPQFRRVDVARAHLIRRSAGRARRHQAGIDVILTSSTSP